MDQVMNEANTYYREKYIIDAVGPLLHWLKAMLDVEQAAFKFSKDNKLQTKEFQRKSKLEGTKVVSVPVQGELSSYSKVSIVHRH